MTKCYYWVVCNKANVGSRVYVMEVNDVIVFSAGTLDQVTDVSPVQVSVAGAECQLEFVHQTIKL